ncbi:MAG: hypothetical protein WDW19_01415 [Neisseriaceae bacterium]
MKKMFCLGLLVLSLAGCSGEQGKKIKEVSNMTMEEIDKVAKSLTPDQVRKIGDAVGRCRVNPDAEVCNKSIKEVIKE